MAVSNPNLTFLRTVIPKVQTSPSPQIAWLKGKPIAQLFPVTCQESNNPDIQNSARFVFKVQDWSSACPFIWISCDPKFRSPPQKKSISSFPLCSQYVWGPWHSLRYKPLEMKNKKLQGQGGEEETGKEGYKHSSDYTAENSPCCRSAHRRNRW